MVKSVRYQSCLLDKGRWRSPVNTLPRTGFYWISESGDLTVNFLARPVPATKGTGIRTPARTRINPLCTVEKNNVLM
jgi:hypothetical protein